MLLHDKTLIQFSKCSVALLFNNYVHWGTYREEKEEMERQTGYKPDIHSQCYKYMGVLT